jgi:gliding motility-associated-like protein
MNPSLLSENSFTTKNFSNMKNRIRLIIIAVALLAFPKFNFGQAPNLGTAADFVLFSTVGAITNVGTTDPAKYLTHLTGNVGTNSGSSTGFGNVNGVMHDGDGASNTCAANLLLAYNFLSAAIPDSSIVNPVIGKDSTLKAGTYLLPGATSLDMTLTLDAQGNPNAVFIFKMPAGPPVYAFSTSPNAKVILKNGAKASNVFWLITGAVNMGTGTSMKGTIISGGAIDMSASDTLEGRALTINGAINIDNGSIGFLGYVPVKSLTGPKAPVFNASKTFTIFSSIGPVADDNFSHIVGDVGGNTDAPVNYNPLLVTGGIYGINGITAAAAADLLNVYDTLNTARPEDIVLLAPTLFGHNLVLTPHTYLMNAAVTFTDTLYLDALGNPNAVFIIRTNGAFATTPNSKVALINGTQAKNVYWLVNGAVSITANSIFNGTIVTAGGAIDILSGTTLNGRALATNGAVSTASINAKIPANTINGPTNQTVCAGDTARFIVSKTGVGLTYQWRKGLIDVIDGGTISGAKTDSLTIFPAKITDTASNYYVVIMEPFMKNDTSSKVSLMVNTAPIITKEPTNQSACIGDSVRFVVTATGSNLIYQWRKGNINLINGVKVKGATTDTLTLYLVDNTTEVLDYNVIVSGTCSPNDTSKNASFSIPTALNIVIQPVNQAVCTGNPVKLSITNTGAGVTYQWRKGLVNITNSINITGATSDTLTIKSVSITDVALDYNVVIKGLCFLDDISTNASIAVNVTPTITVEPTIKTVCVGDSTSLTVVALGTNLTYQWKRGLVNVVNTANISGANNDTLTFKAVSKADSASNYYVVVSGTCLPNDTSVQVALALHNSPVISVEPNNTTVCPGTSGSLTVTATGSTLSYQWRKGLVNIAGATTNTLTINPVNAVDTASNYNVIVTGICSLTDTSKSVVLALNKAPIITVEPIDKTVCIGTSASFVVTATGTTLSYQWRKALVNIVGATTNTFTINPVTITDTASNYSVILTGICLLTDTSKMVSLQRNLNPIITTEPSNQVVCTGRSASFDVLATGTNLSYQWRKGLVNIIGATSKTLTINPATVSDAALNYSVILSGTCTTNDTSNIVSLTVHAIPEALATTVSPVCLGHSITLTAQPVVDASYLWKNAKAYSSTTQNSVIAVATYADAGMYWLVVTANGCKSDSSVVTIAVSNCDSLNFNIPEGFSPNEDNINDVYIIRGIESYTKSTFTVFNRWGEKVFHASPYLNTWDGKSTMGLRLGGNDLPIGTYFYILDLGDGSSVHKGTIYLNR